MQRRRRPRFLAEASPSFLKPSDTKERERRRTRGEALLCVRTSLDASLHWRWQAATKVQLPARPNSPSSRLRTSAEKRNASASAHACRTLQREKNNWKHASLEEPLTQRVPIVHRLSRACCALSAASEQRCAHCWLCPRLRPRRSRVCQNTSLEHQEAPRHASTKAHLRTFT